jgi:hypothetical protein
MARLVAKRLELTEEHVHEVLTKQATWPTNAQSAAENYPFSMSPKVIADGRGLAAVLRDNAVFQQEAKIIQTVPDFTKAIDPAPLAKYLERP